MPGQQKRRAHQGPQPLDPPATAGDPLEAADTAAPTPSSFCSSSNSSPSNSSSSTTLASSNASSSSSTSSSDRPFFAGAEAATSKSAGALTVAASAAAAAAAFEEIRQVAAGVRGVRLALTSSNSSSNNNNSSSNSSSCNLTAPVPATGDAEVHSPSFRECLADQQQQEQQLHREIRGLDVLPAELLNPRLLGPSFCRSNSLLHIPVQRSSRQQQQQRAWLAQGSVAFARLLLRQQEDFVGGGGTDEAVACGAAAAAASQDAADLMGCWDYAFDSSNFGAFITESKRKAFAASRNDLRCGCP